MSDDQNNNQNDEQDFEDRPDFQVNTGDFFSSIPVLKSEGKRDHFSFEKFDGKENDESLSEEGLDSFTEMLLNESDDPGGSDEEPANAMTQEIITKNKEKWAKRVKERGKKNTSQVLLMVILGLVVVLAGAGGSYFLFFSSSEKQPDKRASKDDKPSTPKTPTPTKPPGTPRTPEVTGKPTEPPDKVDEELQKHKKAAEKAKARREEMAAHLDEVKGVIDRGKKDDIKDAVIEYLKTYPEELKVQLDLLTYLNNNKMAQTASEIYDEWLEEVPDSIVANYLKAKTTEDPEKKQTFLKKVVSSKTFIAPAYQELGRIYMQDRNWREAEKLYRELLKQDPLNREICEELVNLKIRKGELENGLKQIQLLLKDKGIDQGDIASRLIGHAQTLESPRMANNFLIDLKASKGHYDDYQVNNIKNKAIYGKLSEDDFSGGFYPKEAREYHMMFLISKGRDAEVAQIPTPPKDYPDFWKVYIAWKDKSKLFKDLAKLLIRKYEGSTSFIPIIARVWIGDLKPEVAQKKELPKLSKQEQPILLYLLADYYKQKRKKIKASILYSKAAKHKITPYRYLIESSADKF